MEEPGRLQSMGSLWVGHDWVTSLSLFTFTHCGRKWQPTLVFLPGESQGQRSLVVYSPWGHKKFDMTEWLTLEKEKKVYSVFFPLLHLPRRRQWQLTPVLLLLPGESHGWRSVVGSSPWGNEELDTTERLHFHFSLLCIGEGNGNPLQHSCLENPRDGGAWWAAVYGLTQSRTRLKWLSSSSSIDYIWAVEFMAFIGWDGILWVVWVKEAPDTNINWEDRTNQQVPFPLKTYVLTDYTQQMVYIFFFIFASILG